MNAVEFVKKHGWKAVTHALKTAPENHDFQSTDLEPILAKDGSITGFDCKVHIVDFAEVKRLVDAFELVESVGGWSNATALYDEFLCADLKKAIDIVEQCQ